MGKCIDQLISFQLDSSGHSKNSLQATVTNWDWKFKKLGDGYSFFFSWTYKSLSLTMMNKENSEMNSD